MILRPFLAVLSMAATLALAGPAMAQPHADFRGGIRNCQRALPMARRFVGLPERVVRARFRSPRGVIVRYCAMCTRDYRPNRLTFGLGAASIVRSASCG
ncbi:MAG: hypothetical protein JNK84_09645 [Phreatobacter sp.]|uniref:hypothetical protein n=1 Tax=Phreatobacter sp. TaxID=1966341 RepID=UPI001A453660|nr:hypothetical protein [Phreatobacter sp.]MBL8569338.1 hypothetical protein [Phreatobacter sp.]